MNIIGLMACTKKGVIGLKGKIPWRYESEYEYFQNMTYNQIMIMGRESFDSMSGMNLLKHRMNIVFSRNKTLLYKHQDDNVKFVSSLEELYKLELDKNKKIYMIGGGELAGFFLRHNLINIFFLTYIHSEYKGDAYFPLSLIKNWYKKTIIKNNNYTTMMLKKPFSLSN